MATLTRDLARLPNVRKLFIPDRGMMIFDGDLSGADAQVVAWEADDADLKAAFRAGVKIHAKNAEDLFGQEWLDAIAAPGADLKSTGNRAGRLYAGCKGGVHGTNYGARPRTLAVNLGWTVQRAEMFQDRWFYLHPGIKRWQQRVDRDIQATQTVWNAFGYRIIYTDRPSSVYTEALAWIPQSTIAINTRRAARQLRKLPYVELLLQVHDSLVWQVPFKYADRIVEMENALRVVIPYADPLTIQWKLARSDKSWGDCKGVN